MNKLHFPRVHIMEATRYMPFIQKQEIFSNLSAGPLAYFLVCSIITSAFLILSRGRLTPSGRPWEVLIIPRRLAVPSFGRESGAGTGSAKLCDG